jgi:ornithine decarboxylase
MLGAYGVAMATRFNGYGESVDVIAEDAPHASMFPLLDEVAERAIRFAKG